MHKHGPQEARFRGRVVAGLRLSVAAAGCASAVALAALALLALVFLLGDGMDGASPDRLGPVLATCLLLASCAVGTLAVAVLLFRRRGAVGGLLAGLSAPVRAERRERAGQPPSAPTTELLSAPAPHGNGLEPEATRAQPTTELLAADPPAIPGPGASGNPANTERRMPNSERRTR